jgi:hypothetical protein
VDRRKKREVKKLKSDFADDGKFDMWQEIHTLSKTHTWIFFGSHSLRISALIVLVSFNNTGLSFVDYIAAEKSLFASFPDLVTVDHDESSITDDEGDGGVLMDAVYTGT